MEPTKFNGQNVVYAENQPEYIPLPAHKDTEGTVTTCWRFSFKDRIRVLFGARLYWKQMTFNAPLQPVMPHIYDATYQDRWKKAVRACILGES